jgi:Na+/melibiose symporter-like transporter
MNQFWYKLPAGIRALAWFLLLFGPLACFIFAPFLIGVKAAFEMMKYILGFLFVTMLIGIWGAIRDQIKEDDQTRAKMARAREPWKT